MKTKFTLPQLKVVDVYNYHQSTNELVKQKTHLKNHEILDLDFDNQNRIWVGTYEKGLSCN